MRKFLSSIFIFFISAIFFVMASETSLFDEVCSAYNSSFFPGVVEKSVLFEKQYPDSINSENVRLMHGEALIKMYRYKEAQSLLLGNQNRFDESSIENVRLNYLLGLSFYYLEDYENSVQFFYNSCKFYKALENHNEKMNYYDFSVLFAGRSFFNLQNFENSEPLFEYVVRNGKKYSKKDYEEVLQKLFYSYNQQEKFSKTANLFEKIEKSNFTDEVYYTICMYAADAYEKIDKFGTAYGLYTQVVESGNKNAVIAMKKAYILATEKQIANPAQVFATFAQKSNEAPDLIVDFWTRLGIDEFNKGDFNKAQEYFDNARVAHKTEKPLPVVVLYNAKIKLEENLPAEAEQILLELENVDSYDEEIQNFSDSYYSQLLQALFLQQKNSQIKAVYEKIENPDEIASYIMAGVYYSDRDFSNTVQFLEKFCTGKLTLKNVKMFELYASALEKSKKLEDVKKACQIYKTLYDEELLSAEASFEYAKALFICEDFINAQKFAESSNNEQKDYFCGLCLVNLKRWTHAKESFINYIKANNGNPKFNFMAYYYKGYSEYKLNDWRNAYVSFVRFASETQVKTVYAIKACEYASKCALQTGDNKNAAIQAENVLKYSKTDAEKQKALLFCVEIYSNMQNYTKAVEVLKPYTSSKSEFSLQCMYEIARLYEKQNLITLADETYTKIYTENPDSVYAEDSMYNSCELFYSQKDFSTSIQKLNNYIYKYPNGRFLDSALFLLGDSNLKLGNMEKSISINKMLISDYSSSIYLFGAYKNLLTAYYSVEDYSEALKIAKSIAMIYPQQAEYEEIGLKILELERIVGGTDKHISEKISEYEKLGKSATKQGRFSGSELVKYYAADVSLQKQAYQLAKEIFEYQTENDECFAAAQNAEIIADWERKNLNNLEAAKMYLKSAELYRKSAESTENQVAAVLYSAVEAFIASNLRADAEDTAALLEELYPKSKYVNNAKALLK